MVQEEILFKDISCLQLWQPFCLSECNHLCNFVRGHYEEQFCEIILNFDQWFRCRLKDFLSGALAALLLSGANYLCNFGRGHHGKYSCEVILNLNQWFRRRCCLNKSLRTTDEGWTKTDHNSTLSLRLR